MTTIGIYKITSPTGKIYIGQSIDIEKRSKTYKNGHSKNQPALNKSYKKHVFSKHTIEIIQDRKSDV